MEKKNEIVKIWEYSEFLSWTTKMFFFWEQMWTSESWWMSSLKSSYWRFMLFYYDLELSENKHVRCFFPHNITLLSLLSHLFVSSPCLLYSSPYPLLVSFREGSVISWRLPSWRPRMHCALVTVSWSSWRRSQRWCWLSWFAGSSSEMSECPEVTWPGLNSVIGPNISSCQAAAAHRHHPGGHANQPAHFQPIRAVCGA